MRSALILWAVLLSGCGGVERVKHPQISVTPVKLDFGRLAGRSGTKSVTIENKGGAPLTLRQITASSPEFDFTLSNDGSVIAAGAKAELGVTFTPSALGPRIATLTIPSNDVDVAIALSATAVSTAGGCLVVAPDDLDFGSVRQTCSSGARLISISNLCADAVTVDALTLSPEFVLSAATPFAAGAVIDPVGSPPRMLQISFEPTTPQRVTGTLIVKSTRDGTTSTVVATFSGVGDVFGANEDVFVEEPRPKSDVLFVIDNSTSMAALSANTAANLSVAFDKLAQLDGQLAITTMDPANGGRLIGDATNPRVIKPGTPNAKAQFLQKFAQLPVTPDLPPALEVATAAISPSLLAAGNSGLFRPGAAHSIFVITNTDDHSAAPAASYGPALAGYGMAIIARFSTQPGCSNTELGAPRLLEATSQMGVSALQGDACHPTWNGLFNIGTSLTPPRSTFFLTATPSAATITVTFNDASLPSTPNTWAYDPSINAVTFAPSFTLIPGPGASKIVVRYQLACP